MCRLCWSFIIDEGTMAVSVELLGAVVCPGCGKLRPGPEVYAL